MRHSWTVGLFLTAAVVVSLGAATASVDLTGTWNVEGVAGIPDFGITFPFDQRWNLTQTGTQLVRSVDGGPPAVGSIDPASGPFLFDLGPVYALPGNPDLGSCGHAFVSGTAVADSRELRRHRKRVGLQARPAARRLPRDRRDVYGRAHVWRRRPRRRRAVRRRQSGRRRLLLVHVSARPRRRRLR